MVVLLRGAFLSLLMMCMVMPTVAAAASPGWAGIKLYQRVMDFTNTLDAASIGRLTEQLADLEQRKGAQVAVVMLPNTGGVSIETFANQLFRTSQLGRKGIDDGILLLVAKDDRKVRIEVGYGLEGTVTDLLAHRIIEERILPAFRQGNYADGIAQGVSDLIVLVDGGHLPAPGKKGVALNTLVIFLAVMAGSLGGILMSTGKLGWRGGLLASVVVIGGLAELAGDEWRVHLLLVPFCLLVCGSAAGALWMVKPVFFGVLGVLGYVASLMVANHYGFEVSFIHWLVLPLVCLMVVGALALLAGMMRSFWKHSRKAFKSRLLILLMVYLLLGSSLGGFEGWLHALVFCLFVAFFMFIPGGPGSGSGSGSSGGSGSSFGGSGFSGGGGSSGGGGASGGW
ncbi:TPM domain-containing protein [Pseudomonas sp. SDO528_S397]